MIELWLLKNVTAGAVFPDFAAAPGLTGQGRLSQGKREIAGAAEREAGSRSCDIQTSRHFIDYTDDH